MLGPHFYYDLIRLARRGWPTWLRVLYLVILLISLTIIHETQPRDLSYHQLAQQAERGHQYALTIIVLQDVLILLLLPVYVAPAVVEDKENRTIESIFLTHLTDREMALGKLAARLVPLASIPLAGLPLVGFLALYGNIDPNMLIYHEANSLLLLLSGGSICLLISTSSESAFQAISRSYLPVLVLLGFGVVGALAMPWFIGEIGAHYQRTMRGVFIQSVPRYGVSLMLIAPLHAIVAAAALCFAVHSLRKFRLSERRRSRRLTAALSLTDTRAAAPAQRKHRARSRIHPLARAVRDNALFWKECLKDGTGYSLTLRWLLVPLGGIVIVSVLFRVAALRAPPHELQSLHALAAVLPYTAYFVALAAYALLVMFQSTMSVAGEKEQDTLDFLLIIPDERPAILYHKWLGPFWRNWPVLAVAYLGVLLGCGCGVFSLRTVIALLLLPWPSLLLLSTLALWLSVRCRRVLVANLILIGCLAALLVAHVAAWSWLGDVVRFYFILVFEANLHDFAAASRDVAFWLALGQQAAFLLVAAACGALALRSFRTV
jgi:ABC-type transport system involved in multi-copper enzyme maturation permease subunit